MLQFDKIALKTLVEEEKPLKEAEQGRLEMAGGGGRSGKRGAVDTTEEELVSSTEWLKKGQGG
jgi:hypothetical protein